MSRQESPEGKKAVQDLESKMLMIFGTVSDWLKFAEAKNVGLLVFSGAAIAAIFSLLGSATAMPANWKSGLILSAGLLAVSSLTALYSFLPRTRLDKVLLARKGVPSETDNLYFYGDLCKYSKEDLLDALSRHYYPSVPPAELRTRNHSDIAAQIVANSQIAMRKYNLFRIALWSSVLAILGTPAGALIWYAVALVAKSQSQ